jgi:hypothetical protein
MASTSEQILESRQRAACRVPSGAGAIVPHIVVNVAAPIQSFGCGIAGANPTLEGHTDDLLRSRIYRSVADAEGTGICTSTLAAPLLPLS